MHTVSHKGEYVVLQFFGNSPASLCFFVQFLSEGLEQVKFPNIVEIEKYK